MLLPSTHYYLHSPKLNSNNSGYSIFLISGLTGDPINTWSYGDICWPRDLLPQALSSPVRILSFGYNPSRHSNVYPDIEDSALHLISELERVRPVKVNFTWQYQC